MRTDHAVLFILASDKKQEATSVVDMECRVNYDLCY